LHERPRHPELGNVVGRLPWRLSCRTPRCPFERNSAQEIGEIQSVVASDLIVALGSSRGAYEDVDWVHHERSFVRAAIDADVPVFGICFGAQLIATAVGGNSAPVGRRYTGWYENDVPRDSVWHGPRLRWHSDEISAPRGAEIIATSDSLIQAFQYRRALGVQFHPEADDETLEKLDQTCK
jgi:GMP synthase (glutamine-hydrolysing)